MIKKNLREWEECLPHVEFAYNRAVHTTTQLCPFEVVYGFKPITPLDLLPLPLQDRVNMEASQRADYVKKIHEKTREAIEKQGKNVAAARNQSRKQVLFHPGDMVWVHLCKDRFPGLWDSKLKPRGAGPYKVLSKINDNAYSIDIPIAEFGGASNNFNVADLSPHMGDDLGASGSTPFEGGGGDDEDIPTTTTTSPTIHDEQANQIRLGPVTRARAKLLKQQVNLLLLESDDRLSENYILPKSLCVCMIRYQGEDKELGGAEVREEEDKEQGQATLEEEPQEAKAKKIQASGRGTTALDAVLPRHGTTARTTAP